MVLIVFFWKVHGLGSPYQFDQRRKIKIRINAVPVISNIFFLWLGSTPDKNNFPEQYPRIIKPSQGRNGYWNSNVRLFESEYAALRWTMDQTTDAAIGSLIAVWSNKL